MLPRAPVGIEPGLLKVSAISNGYTNKEQLGSAADNMLIRNQVWGKIREQIKTVLVKEMTDRVPDRGFTFVLKY
jgi:hypothetical protein